MTRTTSSAVMARQIEPHDSLDDFPTPPWATRALMERVILPHVGAVSGLSCCEPACNRGYMVRPLREYFGEVFASDIHDYGGLQQARVDFLWPGSGTWIGRDPDWIITNPPFRLAEQFIVRARKIAAARAWRCSCAPSSSRLRSSSSACRWSRGRHDPSARTATAYCWLVWTGEASGTAFTWIPPCRRDLEREQDARAAA